MKVVSLFPLVSKCANLKMSEDETKDYLMVHSCYDSWISADHNRLLSNKNLHLNSLCIYCFTLISMTRKRGSGPWQKMVINKMYRQENNVRHRLQTKHINNKNVHYHPFRSLNEYVWQQIDIHSRWNSRYGQKTIYDTNFLSIEMHLRQTHFGDFNGS